MVDAELKERRRAEVARWVQLTEAAAKPKRQNRERQRRWRERQKAKSTG